MRVGGTVLLIGVAFLALVPAAQAYASPSGSMAQALMDLHADEPDEPEMARASPQAESETGQPNTRDTGRHGSIRDMVARDEAAHDPQTALQLEDQRLAYHFEMQATALKRQVESTEPPQMGVPDGAGTLEGAARSLGLGPDRETRPAGIPDARLQETSGSGARHVATVPSWPGSALDDGPDDQEPETMAVSEAPADVSTGAARYGPLGAIPSLAAGATATALVAGGLVVLTGWRRVVGFGAALFSRFTKDDVLEHPMRSRLHDVVVENPGINLVGLRQAAGCGRSQAEHHMAVLEKHRLVVSKRVGRARHFFKNGAGITTTKTAYAVLQNDRTEAIASFIASHPGALQRDIREAFQTGSSTVSWHVRRLQEAGLVQRVVEGRTTRHFPVGRLEQRHEDGAPASLAENAMRQGA